MLTLNPTRTLNSTNTMKKILFTLFAFIIGTTVCTAAAHVTRNPKAVTALLDRIGGNGTAARFDILLDPALAEDGNEVFVLTDSKGLPAVKGSSISAITTGIGWYLHHYAKVNITWNQLTTDLTAVTLPLPPKDERHVCDAEFRYYLNYCTFGYSMTTWTWKRWEQEIDWMALHGINMPLQIIGLESVWRSLLMEDYGYSEAEAEAFIPGPAFTAWWGMNNLEGWGGDGQMPATGVKNNAWYERQTALAKRIVKRERELGMQPVLPGFSGMVPSSFNEKTGMACENQGGWCGFQRPFIMDPTTDDFKAVAKNYYRHLRKVMGQSAYYSMDPFHEGGSIASGKYAEGFSAVFQAMNDYCGTSTRWVIQQWQWSANQALSLQAVPAGRLVVLDLFSDGNPQFDRYAGYAPQHAVYCAIPNFGGRTGFFGRIPKMADNYFTYKEKYGSIRGVGAAPEAIEQTPVVYDLLFQLPWMGKRPDVDKWMKGYAEARYGVASPDGTGHADLAWNILLHTALNNTTTLQGPHEAVVCARPALSVGSVSSWGGTSIFYDRQQMAEAAYQLLEAYDEVQASSSPIARQNYSYDLVDISRQVLTDYAKSLLAGIESASADTLAGTLFQQRREAFLQLILDLDRLLGTNRMFRLGNWTETARLAAEEVKGCTEDTRDWFELDNARTLITTWGDQRQSEGGGLRDYSYREWQGMLRDFYYPRWKYWFSHQMHAPEEGWFFTEWNWAHETEENHTGSTLKGTTGTARQRTFYSPEPEGDTYTIAAELLNKYIIPTYRPDGSRSFDYYLLPNIDSVN